MIVDRRDVALGTIYAAKDPVGVYRIPIRTYSIDKPTFWHYASANRASDTQCGLCVALVNGALYIPRLALSSSVLEEMAPSVWP